ncbi:DUF4179 domain-containing protein [Paenibacillus sp. S150]|uniref:DUF4179 domain-containing protein n=1 Tax=Paenibacillus sp. S150 TaxID=2749826 RepID=UPI001C573F9B|nr:DUF4179 domain-containing protein [Paenibacillus sp. S150]MBW4080645.1 DUF4179 domain-containing protein [Paenibacillus sp. S150]
MANKEEQALERSMEEIKRRAVMVPDMQMYTAMRSGIREGKRRERRRKYTYGIAAAAAVIIAAQIAIYPDVPNNRDAILPVQTSYGKHWNDSEIYQSANLSDPALANALERNLIKPVYTSVENKGIRVEILGAVTDGRKAFILYNVQNHSEQTVIHAGFSLDYGTIKAPFVGASLEMAGSSSQIGPGQTVNFAYSATLLPSVDYPKNVRYNAVFTQISEKALSSSSSKYRTSLSIPFELDSGMFQDETMLVPVNRSLTVDGQKIMVNQLLYTPLGTYVDMAYDENNSKQVFQLLNPVLLGKIGDTASKLYYPGIITADNSEVYTDASKFTLVFSGSPQKFDSVSLKIAGIAALDKNEMNITVDLNKKQIIQAPGKDLTLAEPAGTTEAGQVLFSRTIQKIQSLTSFNMRLADSFTDAKGAAYKISGDIGYTSRMVSEDAVAEAYAYNFGAQAVNYPQPLTIAIERYWNPIIESHTLELDSK